MSAFPKGSIIWCQLNYVEVSVKNGVTGVQGEIINKGDNVLNVVYGMSKRGEHYAYGNNTDGYLHLYKDIDNVYTKLSNPSQVPQSIVQECEFNSDASLLAVCMDTTPHFHIYNTSDWSRKPDPAVLIDSDVNNCGFSPDGNYVAFSSDLTPFLHVYNVSDMTKHADVASIPNSFGYDVKFSPDSSLCVICTSVTPYLHIYNTSDWSKLANVPILPGGPSYFIEFSPDGSKLAVQFSVSTFIRIYNTTDWTSITVDPVINIYDSFGAGHAGVHWLNNDILFGGYKGTPAIVEYNANTGATIKQHESIGITNAFAIEQTDDWEINGTIDEALVADTWVATVTDYETNSTLGFVEFTGVSFTVPVANARPVIVTVSAKQGDIWKDSLLNVGVDDKVFPTDPISTPYYYVATVAGTTGVTEPVWPVDAGGTVVDGSVTWQRVERLIQPVTQSPLIPTPV